MNVRIHRLALAVLAFSLMANATAATRTTVAPARLMDLSHFKLTLPVDSSGNPSGTAATIKTPELSGTPGYSSQFFYSDSDAAVVFNAPSNGATTSPGVGSDHTRTELRELYNVAGPTEWTNRIGGTMRASCKINRIAAQSKVTIIGQIHGLDSIMVILRYNVTKKTIELRPYGKPNGTATTLTLASNIALGTRISYTIQLIGSTLSTTVNGKFVNLTVDPSWNDVPVYFKAGTYTDAPDSGNAAGDASEVAFSSLYIQH